jgi:hypothetical protein
VACNHDEQRCGVCGTCRRRFPHAAGSEDESGVQGGCRDAHLQASLKEFDVYERGARSILAALETGNAENEAAARELLDDLDGHRNRMLGTGGL